MPRGMRPDGRRRRRRHAYGHDLEYQDVLRLWILRLVVHGGLLRRLVHAGHCAPAAIEMLLDVEFGNMEADDARALHRRLKSQLTVAERSPVASPLDATLEVVREELGLDEVAAQVIGFTALMKTQEALAMALDGFGPVSDEAIVGLTALALGVPTADVRAALHRRGPLRTAELVSITPRVDGFTSRVVCLVGLSNAILSQPKDGDGLLGNFLAIASPTKLNAGSFQHVEEDFVILARYLRKAVRESTKGVNVLIHGAPGTGKTELAKVLAASVDATLYEVPEFDPDGDPMGSTWRMRSFGLCQQLLKGRDTSILLFDEIEDAFPLRPSMSFFAMVGGPVASGEDKAQTNRLLENNPVPAIWVANAIDHIDEAFLRRFAYCLKLDTPPKDVRAGILRQRLRGLRVSRRWIEETASVETLTPAEITRAADVVRLLGSTKREAERDLERVLFRASPLRNGPPPRKKPATTGYTLDHLNCSEPPDRLIEAFKRCDAANVLLYGSPGTGKTAFAHHVADALGRPLLVKRASDILGSFVGQTEQALAAMFRDAANSGSILLLDEVDSLLSSRRRAQHNFELTQTNELLSQMEDFPGLFFCTTNFLDAVDDAALRRFVFKVRFDYLRLGQREELFAQMVRDFSKHELNPEATAHATGVLTSLPNLAVGDFAAVGKRIAILGAPVTPKEILAQLSDTAGLKPDRVRRVASFTAH